jgi:hypothetical protein
MAAARDGTAAAELPMHLAPTPPAPPAPKGKRKGAKGRAKAPRDGDDLLGARVFMPGRCDGEGGGPPARQHHMPAAGCAAWVRQAHARACTQRLTRLRARRAVSARSLFHLASPRATWKLP